MKDTMIDRPVPRVHERRGEAFHRRLQDSSYRNLDQFRQTRRALTGAQSRRLAEYFIDVVAEAAEPTTWAKILTEARRRVTLYFPED